MSRTTQDVEFMHEGILSWGGEIFENRKMKNILLFFDPPGECPDQSEASEHNVCHLLAPGVLQQLGQLQQRVRAVVQQQHHRADADEVA